MIKYIMSCNCIVAKKDLHYVNQSPTCPKHPESFVKEIHKTCLRCGGKIVTSKMGFEKTYCEQCSNTIDQARSVSSLHECKYVDPMLQYMTDEQIQDAIIINSMLGYEAVKVTKKRKNQWDTRKVTFDPYMRTWKETKEQE